MTTTTSDCCGAGLHDGGYSGTVCSKCDLWCTTTNTKDSRCPSASDYVGDIIYLYDKMQDLQRTINQIAEKAKSSPDYEEYKESITSYTTMELL